MKATEEPSPIDIATNRVRPNSFNPNLMDIESYSQLLEDVKAHGPNVVDPIHVQLLGNHVYEILDGYHRWKVFNQLGFGEIRAYVHDKMSLVEAIAYNYRKNSERGRLNPVKEAENFKKLHDMGHSYRDLEKLFNIDHTIIERRARIAEPSVLRDLKPISVASTQHLGPTHLAALAEIPSPLRKRVVQEIRPLVETCDLTVSAIYKAKEKLSAKDKKPRDNKGAQIDACPCESLLRNIIEIINTNRDPTRTCDSCNLRSNGCEGLRKQLETYGREICKVAEAT